MIKRFLFILPCLALFAATALTSCSDDDKGNVTPEKGEKQKPDVEVLKTQAETVILANVQDTLKAHFQNQVNVVGDKTKVLIINRNDVNSYSKEITKVEDNDGVIIVMENPDNEFEITATCKKYNSKYYHQRTVVDIDPNGIHENETPEGGKGEEGVIYPHIYTDKEFAEWTSKYNALVTWVEQQMDPEFVTNESDRMDVAQFGAQERISYTFSFHEETQLRKIWFEPYYVRGDGTCTNSYTIYKLFAYNDQPGSGDYYMVRCNSSIASGNMYKGRWKDIRVGIQIRQTGYYLKNVTFTHQPVNEKGEPYTTDIVYIPADGRVSPETQVDSREIVNSKSFGINLSAGGVGGASAEKGPFAEGHLNIGFNWGWNHSERYIISDLNIQNLSSGNVVKHKFDVKNYPEYKWAEKYGFTEGCYSCKSTIQLLSSWIWYFPNTKDNDIKQNLFIKTGFSAEYGAMSFTTTDVNLEKFEAKPSGSHTLSVQAPNRQTVGIVNLENTFKDMSISNIRAYDKDGKEVFNLQSTFKPGEKVQLGLKTGVRSLKFSAGTSAATEKDYALIKGPVTVEKNKTIQLKTDYDFTVK